MMDDSLGVRIVEELQSWLEKLGIEVILGETDVETCFYQINANDFLIIIDATQFGYKPGTITKLEIETIKQNYKGYFQHDINLIDYLKRYNRKNKGYFIGVEACEIAFGINLSIDLQIKYSEIIGKTKKIIMKIMEDLRMHDTFLFEKLSDTVFDLCNQNKIDKINYLNVSVFKDSHINKDTLYQYLQDKDKCRVGDWTKIEVDYNHHEPLTVIIKQIEGI